MELRAGNVGEVVETSKRLALRLLSTGETRVKLMMVEALEERERFLRACLLALGMWTSGLLAAITLCGAIVVLFWELSRVGALLGLAALSGATALYLYRRLMRLRRDWHILPATADQLRKDRECLERHLTSTCSNPGSNC